MALFKKTRSGSKRKPNKRNWQNVESLEDRRLMAADLMFNWAPEIEFNGDGTDVLIDGSSFHDTATVKLFQNGTADPVDDAIQIKVSNNIGFSDTLTLQRLDPQGNERIHSIIFKGYGGNDKFTNNVDLPSKAYGGSGDDTLIGGANVDKFYGGYGNDALRGNGGDDTLHGDKGSDNVIGGDGDDTIRGGDGNDTLSGGSGEDSLRGDAGDDRMFGGRHNDWMSGGRGNNVMYGGTGNDQVSGGNGDDVLWGGQGHDTLRGFRGDDVLYGGNGNDLMLGDSGDDRMRGGWGRDFMIGGTGMDFMAGQGDNDVLIPGEADIFGYDGTSRKITLIDDGEDDSFDSMSGGAGNDTFIVGDYGFFDFEEDTVEDEQDGDWVQYTDPFGIDFFPIIIPNISPLGHKA